MSEEATLNEVDGEAGEEASVQETEQHLPEIDGIPEGWELVTVEEVARDLIGGGTPTKSNDEYWGGEIPWASVKDLNGIELADTEDHITEAGAENSTTNIIPANSVVVSTRMTVGEPFLNLVDMAINQDMKAIIPETERANSLFLVYSLWDRDPYLKSLGRGTTVDGITTRDLSLTHLGLPPLEEQQNIATVLYTVDQAIQKTEKIIEQAKRYKSGVKQDIFRTGVFDGETKEVPTIGKIPDHWKIERLGTVSEWVTDGTHTPYSAQEEGYPCLTGKNIRDHGFRLDDVKKVSEEAFEEMRSRVRPQEDDILFVKDGSIGYTQVNDLDFEFGILESVLLIRVDDCQLRPQYLQQLLTWDPFRDLLISRRVGTGIERMTISGMKKAEIIVPPLEEQKKIENILLDIDEYIGNESDCLDTLRRIKKGLMQDLLSGIVRTTDTNIEVPEQIAQHG
jgi:type I restriction enzyme S subunit